jgi:hydrogenase maturation protein HypF
VVRIDRDRPRVLRRARGYAPAPITLPDGFEQTPPLLALGAELKNTFCLLQDGQAIVSQHLGDLEDARTSDAWEKSLALYQQLFQHRPQAILVDRHPGYRSTRHGRELAAGQQLPLIQVQHHHAHIASVLADNDWPLQRGPVLGVALDGLGMGDDGTLWGGEFLRADYVGFERLAHLPAVALPGGTQAILEPWRNTWSQLYTGLGRDGVREATIGTELGDWLQQRPLDTFAAMLERGINAPLSSSCGRLFDAVAGALGVCRERIHYEGQAAIELENLAASADAVDTPYPFALSDRLLETREMWLALLDDLRRGVDRRLIAARFHRGLAEGVTAITARLCVEQGLDTVALSGGVFQNRLLFGQIEQHLQDAGLTVLSHQRLPTNDGGISFGQALVGAARLLAGNDGS